MIGRLEYFDPQQFYGFVAVERDTGKGYKLIDRYFLRGSHILVAVPDIRRNNWVKFHPGPQKRSGEKPLCLEAEIWSSPALAYEADQARPGTSHQEDVQRGIDALASASNGGTH